MTATRVLVRAEPDDADLVCAPGEFDWGHVVAGAGIQERDARRFDLVAGFGAASEGAQVRWLERADVTAGPDGSRTIAPVGDGLWSRALWPASDRLFEMAPAAVPHALVVGSSSFLRDLLIERALDRRLAFDAVERLSAEALARASCVVLLEALGSGALPARTAAVLAARRVLLAPRAEVCFGLQPNLDHLQLDEPDQAVNLVESVLTRPQAFERLLHWGSVAARRHRASEVFGRLAAEVRGDRAAAAP